MEPLFVTEGISDKKFLNETIPVLRKNGLFRWVGSISF